MPEIFEKVKELYWNNSFMTSESKENFFYYVRGVIKGKNSKNIEGNELINKYISNILEKQLPSDEYDRVQLSSQK